MRVRLWMELLGISNIRPWMESWEIELIRDVLIKLQPRICLEWGCGYSTVHFTRFLPKDSKWIAIEHDQNWSSTVQQQISLLSRFHRRRNVTVNYVKQNQYPWTDKDGDGAGTDLADYIQFPDKFKPFDFVLVDGRARKECIKKAYELIGDKGVVILHDANRTSYHQFFGLYKYQILFTDTRDSAGGVWIGSNGVDIHQLLETEKSRGYFKYINL